MKKKDPPDCIKDIMDKYGFDLEHTDLTKLMKAPEELHRSVSQFMEDGYTTDHNDFY